MGIYYETGARAKCDGNSRREEMGTESQQEQETQAPLMGKGLALETSVNYQKANFRMRK